MLFSSEYQENPSPFANNLGTFVQEDGMSQLHYTSFMNNIQNFQNYAPQSSSGISNNSTSDEGDDHPHHLMNNIIDERRHRRMISNRESARRSRMRKQKHLDELWSQVVQLRNENYSLVDKLNQVMESHDKLAQENGKLKEEASGLRKIINDAQLATTFNSLKDLDDVVQ